MGEFGGGTMDGAVLMLDLGSAFVLGLSADADADADGAGPGAGAGGGGRTIGEMMISVSWLSRRAGNFDDGVGVRLSEWRIGVVKKNEIRVWDSAGQGGDEVTDRLAS